MNPVTIGVEKKGYSTVFRDGLDLKGVRITLRCQTLGSSFIEMALECIMKKKNTPSQFIIATWN